MRSFFKRSRLDIVIIFLVIIALLLTCTPFPAAHAIAGVDDVIVAGGLAAWFAGLGISLSGAFGGQQLTTDSFVAGLKALADTYDTAKNKVTGWFWSQAVGLASDISVLASETGKKVVEFGKDIGNLFTDLYVWVRSEFGLTSGQTTSFPIVHDSGYFLQNGTKILWATGNARAAQQFLVGSVYTLSNGNTFELRSTTSGSGVTNYRFFVNGSKYEASSWGDLTGTITSYGFGFTDGQNQSKFGIGFYYIKNDSGNVSYIHHVTDTYGIAGLFGDPTQITMTGTGADLWPNDTDIEDGYSGYVSIPGSITNSLPANPSDTDVLEGVLSAGAAGLLTNTGADALDLEISQSVPVEADPEAPYDYQTPGLSNIFPFCIPFDIYNFFRCLLSNREAPHLQATIDLKIVEWEIDIDLAAWDTVATILRTMELLAFCVLLAVKTRDLIRG